MLSLIEKLYTNIYFTQVSGVPVRNELLYDMNDVWSKIQAVVSIDIEIDYR